VDFPESNEEVAAGAYWPDQLLVANVPKECAGRPDVSRRTFDGSSERWHTPIRRALLHYLRDNDIADALEESPKERVAALGKVVTYYGLNVEEAIELIPHDAWPAAVLKSNGSSEVVNIDLAEGENVVLLPEEIVQVVAHTCDEWCSEKPMRNWDWKRILGLWRGVKSVVLLEQELNGVESSWLQLFSDRVNRRIAPERVRFVRSALPGLAPLPQLEGVIVDTSRVSIRDVLRSAVSDPLSLSPVERTALRNSDLLGYQGRAVFRAVAFEQPFANCFSYGSELFNLSHPGTKVLFRCAAAIASHKLEGTLPAADIGNLEDGLDEVMTGIPRYIRGHSWSSALRQVSDLYGKFCAIVQRLRACDLTPADLEPRQFDSVWGSLDYERIHFFRGMGGERVWEKMELLLRQYGDALIDSSEEELPAEIRSKWSDEDL
jgi:hypothetical protein